MITHHGTLRARQRIGLSSEQAAVVIGALWNIGHEAADGDFQGGWRRPGTEGRIVLYRGVSWVIVRDKRTGKVITVYPKTWS